MKKGILFNYKNSDGNLDNETEIITHESRNEKIFDKLNLGTNIKIYYKIDDSLAKCEKISTLFFLNHVNEVYLAETEDLAKEIFFEKDNSKFKFNLKRKRDFQETLESEQEKKKRKVEIKHEQKECNKRGLMSKFLSFVKLKK